IYLDYIIIYLDTLKDHEKHVILVLDILQQQKLYLGKKELHFLCKEMKVLEHIVNDSGIQMDPHKVDSVLKWKVSTNCNLLHGFLGSVGY
ncbi:hypothetical protein SERLA73DRAFT_42568, partial [Serpula lacrymans var. lacrymans S7.3]